MSWSDHATGDPFAVRRRRGLGQQAVVVRRREVAARVAGVHHAGRLDQHHRHLAVGDRTVLDASRHDVQLALAQLHVAVAQLDA